MAYFSTKKQLIFEYLIHWNINIRKKQSLRAIPVQTYCTWSVMLSHINSIIIVHVKSYLSQCLYVLQLLKYDGNIVVKYEFSKSCCGKDCLKP